MGSSAPLICHECWPKKQNHYGPCTHAQELVAKIARLREERDAALKERDEAKEAGKEEYNLRKQYAICIAELEEQISERAAGQTATGDRSDSACIPSAECGNTVPATAALAAAQDREGRLNSVHIDVCEKLKQAQDRERRLVEAAKWVLHVAHGVSRGDGGPPSAQEQRDSLEALQAALSPAAAPPAEEPEEERDASAS